ncbi:TetR/AcrR family transcriptional regulator C-terminal domain-containing protein [Nonomuraea sp. NPDC050404]|uniref:TetR/AcrR family transcriptional regulator C-terminal domain-containing protein n=1 Tax=Nonomuraea sp. NPDC050404 TaxID=3155783 RepID=UPI0033C6E892
MDNVWSRDRKAPRQRLTLERIVAEALELLDEEGVGRLTMRRLAERLDTGSTTLYWHVKTKDDVLDLALDAVFREVRLDALEHENTGLDAHGGSAGLGGSAARGGSGGLGGTARSGERGGGVGLGSGVGVGSGGDWRGPVRGLMRGWRAALLRHPWSAALLDRPLMGPNALERTEFLYERLIAAGFTAPKAAAYSLSNYVMGSVIMQVTWQDSDEADTGDFLRERGGRYPALAEHGLDHEWDATFDEGLGYLLDGMEQSRAGR